VFKFADYIHSLRLLKWYQLFIHVLINYPQKSSDQKVHFGLQYNRIPVIVFQVSNQYPRKVYNGWFDGQYDYFCCYIIISKLRFYVCIYLFIFFQYLCDWL